MSLSHSTCRIYPRTRRSLIFTVLNEICFATKTYFLMPCNENWCVCGFIYCKSAYFYTLTVPYWKLNFQSWSSTQNYRHPRLFIKLYWQKVSSFAAITAISRSEYAIYEIVSKMSERRVIILDRRVSSPKSWLQKNLPLKGGRGGGAFLKPSYSGYAINVVQFNWLQFFGILLRFLVLQCTGLLDLAGGWGQYPPNGRICLR